MTGLGLGITMQQRRGFDLNSLFSDGEDGALYPVANHDGEFYPEYVLIGFEGALYTIFNHDGNA